MENRNYCLESRCGWTCSNRWHGLEVVIVVLFLPIVAAVMAGIKYFMLNQTK